MRTFEKRRSLNAVCPYFTMFPIEFPLRVLGRRRRSCERVLDPFCGRGTTLYAGRLLGLHAYGIDSNPVAVAISEGKLANTTPTRILRCLDEILTADEHVELPEGEFWRLAYTAEILSLLCRLRQALLKDCRSDTRKALRAVLLGSLHGPVGKTTHSYFSNQMPRTFSSKPAYSVKFWKEKKMRPPKVNLRQIVAARAERYFDDQVSRGFGAIICADSRDAEAFGRLDMTEKVDCVITSPPYYGLRTYLSDQWLRLWFVGGPSEVEYATRGQLTHTSQNAFIGDLRAVWTNLQGVCRDGCTLVVRFGAINDRPCNALKLLKESLDDTKWDIAAVRRCGSAADGRRQALHFMKDSKEAQGEYDLWATLTE